MSDVVQLVRAVEEARARLLAAVEDVTEAQAAFRPAEGAWSIVDVVEHLYLAELSGHAKVWWALLELQEGRGWTEPRAIAGQSIESVIAATWRPKEAAPPVATPHIGGPLAFWRAATRSLSVPLAALGEALAGMELEAIVFPHFLSGPLDARQRLEFWRYHIERHLGQLAAIQSAPGFPAT